MAAMAAMLLVASFAATPAESAYTLKYNYAGYNFFDNFDFWTQNDPTHGYVNYVDRNTAQSQGLISAGPHNCYIGADHNNVASGRGRSSVRLSSKATFSDGLVIADLSHMPEGCGTWPAFWMVGPNWPNGGEIDIIEGVNTNNADQTTLHTSQGCDMSGEDRSAFTGDMVSTNCWVNAPNQGNNQGCGIQNYAGSYGVPFNQAGGGVYATEFGHGWPIKVWFFPRNNIPADIQSGRPVPTNWGKPFAQFNIGNNCPAGHFYDMQIIINLTFCGDWAGSVFSSSCGQYGSCNNFVQYNPAQFGDAYWIFNSIKVYQYQF